ncbi:hypothetical protein V6C27_09180 [Peptococcaceae bacterium 1198_IL3148]
MTTTMIEICVSDADVLVNLSLTGHLELMGKVFDKVLIPDKVLREAQKKIATRGKGMSLRDAQLERWLQVINIDTASDLTIDELNSIKIFCESYDCFLGPGELKAAALANEKNINWLVSDDKEAKKYIEEFTDINCISLFEIISLCCIVNILNLEEGKLIFDEINAIRRPTKLTFEEIVKRTKKKFTQLGLI